MISKLPHKDISFVKSYFSKLYGENSSRQMDRYNDLFSRFKLYFSVDEAFVASSSGRVEVCGNHTDHNGGKVVACAISLDTLAMFLPTDNNVIRIKSDGYSEIVVDVCGEEIEQKGTSSALVRGVCVALKNKGYKVGGFNAMLTSNVLGGAGISSSASFEVLIAEILNFIYNDGVVSNEEKAIIAQFSEREYFGKPCGLLDQSAIAFGGLNKLDFSVENKVKVSTINNSLDDYTLVLINTGGSHANLTDEYASIPQEMFSVAKCFGRERLIDVDEKEFYEKLPTFYEKIDGRALCRSVHFFEENKRVDALASALEVGDFNTFLKAVNESGKSSLCLLQNCFVAGDVEQVIPKALAFTSNFLGDGANRIHGGGFAGCILNIVKTEDLNLFVKVSAECFGAQNVIPLKVRSVGAIVL